MTTLLKGLSRQSRQRFDEHGLVKLEGLVARRTAEQMADILWQDLARRHRIQRRDRATWRIERPSDFKQLRQTDAFRAMATPEVRAVLDDLLGRGQWVEPDAWGQPLVCFPTPRGRWDVPHQHWHLDLPAHPERFRLLIGRLFMLVAPLRAQGGGTLVATGSHRLIEALSDQADVELSSAVMRRHLKSQHRWFAELMAPTRDFDRSERFMGAPTLIQGVPIQVEEMTGEPGDVFLMHPAALHAGAPNTGDEPRLVLTQFVNPKAYFA
ncbi:phytanoyl-CoA dioxygenase family protein [Phenylobacterium sp.]|jgi:ectoine hydroxylase-related dioxygenase (phytanoyl-CoA dioxygenase family)|uniref:phytanoyl-CoA dioxygenase family protein n=1 Tax=Phenylobacterium sp. TaxID=1871053 RepID=UPI002F95D919